MAFRMGTLAIVFTAITACGSGGSDSETSRKLADAILESPGPACVEAATIKMRAHETTAELACRLPVSEGATLAFIASEEPGCRPYFVGVANNEFGTRAIRIETSHGADKTYVQTISFGGVKVLPDRKSNWMFYGGPGMDYPEEACSEIPLKIENVLCSGAQIGAFGPCEESIKIELLEPDFYKSYSAEF